MARPALAALAVIAATIAAGYAVEAARFQDHTVTWTETVAATLVASGEGAEGDPWAAPLDVAGGPVARVRASLAWQDDVGDPDTLVVTLVAPDGTRHEAEPSMSGALQIVVEVTPAPAPRTLGAPSAAAARALAPPPYPAGTGAGLWQVVVEVVEAAGVRVAGRDLPTGPDAGNAFDVQAEATVWAQAT